ncbi:MAG: hypothetical protein HYY84_12790 [Deltaproteobacteria bacterium]|nr:hypothetical protein [Deltaproteobacteria bacterium]
MKRFATTLTALAFFACSKVEEKKTEYFPIFFTGVMFPGFVSGQPDQTEQVKFIQWLKARLATRSYEAVAGYNLFDLGNDSLCSRLQNSGLQVISGRTYDNGWAWPPVTCAYGFWSETGLAKLAWDQWRLTSASTDFPASKRAMAINDRDVKLIRDFAVDGGQLSGGDIVYISKPIFDVVAKPYVDGGNSPDLDFEVDRTVTNIYSSLSQAGWNPQRVALAIELLDPRATATAPTTKAGQPVPSSAQGLVDTLTCDTSIATFATTCYRSFVKNLVRQVALAKQPEWLFVGTSLERYAVANPQDFTNLASLYREIYFDLKDAGVTSKIGPGIDWAVLRAQAASGGTGTDGGAAAVSMSTYWASVVAPFLHQPVATGVDGGVAYTGAATADLIGVSAFINSADYNGFANDIPTTYFDDLFVLAVK